MKSYNKNTNTILFGAQLYEYPEMSKFFITILVGFPLIVENISAPHSVEKKSYNKMSA